LPPKRILLAETHQTFVGVVRLILKDTGSTMLTAADELSLVEVVTDTRFDLVIADLSFPISSDVNVARLLHRLNPGLKVIIVSVHDEPSVAEECIAVGAQGFVLKRTAFAELRAAVETVLSGGAYISPAVALEKAEAGSDVGVGLASAKRCQHKSVAGLESEKDATKRVLSQGGIGLSPRLHAERSKTDESLP
jgi:DNA-binding NarL/FixJ family response regulator